VGSLKMMHYHQASYRVQAESLTAIARVVPWGSFGDQVCFLVLADPSTLPVIATAYVALSGCNGGLSVMTPEPEVHFELPRWILPTKIPR
jgi:hypothetical protein